MPDMSDNQVRYMERSFGKSLVMFCVGTVVNEFMVTEPLRDIFFFAMLFVVVFYMLSRYVDCSSGVVK